ncbi:hypothetical protein [Mycolicibacterium sphagni]|uniref:hypothetical protein n=1 Tax=Mycolicibacterium sphagni TaxID=1786 RepID=UPI001F041379|nr:hypothetical protein [Mycolicibacterium sphagni]
MQIQQNDIWAFRSSRCDTVGCGPRTPAHLDARRTLNQTFHAQMDNRMIIDHHHPHMPATRTSHSRWRRDGGRIRG